MDWCVPANAVVKFEYSFSALFAYAFDIRKWNAAATFCGIEDGRVLEGF